MPQENNKAVEVPRSIGHFYTSVLGANLKNARWSWGAIEPLTESIFLRVWGHDIFRLGDIEYVKILRKGVVNKSPGLNERRHHVHSLQNGASGFGVVCKAKNPDPTEIAVIESFDHDQLIRFGSVIEHEQDFVATIVDRTPVDHISKSQTGFSTIVPDVIAVAGMKVESTTKERLALARVGQGWFRQQVLKNSSCRCAVTGCTATQILRASHIKPWRDSTDEERLDPSNGIALVATLDALFDCGLITFDHDGCGRASSRLSDEQQQLLGIKQFNLTSPPTPQMNKFFDHHRAVVFK